MTVQKTQIRIPISKIGVIKHKPKRVGCYDRKLKHKGEKDES
jgi:hypothetical protein